MNFDFTTYLANFEGLANHLDEVAAECDRYVHAALTDEDRKADEVTAEMARRWSATVPRSRSTCGLVTFRRREEIRP